MERTIWISITVLAIAAAGFFGFRAYQLSRDPGVNTQSAEMQRELDAARLAARDAARKADQDAEARRLGELKAKEEAEADARRLAQMDRDRQGQEQARKNAEDDAAKAAAELDRMRAEKAQLSSEAQRLAELRTREGADAQARLAAAQRALEESERKKNAEIERQAAVIASYSRVPNKVEKLPEKDAARHSAARVIFPSDYKRANHYNLPLLPYSEKESK